MVRDPQTATDPADPPIRDFLGPGSVLGTEPNRLGPTDFGPWIPGHGHATRLMSHEC